MVPQKRRAPLLAGLAIGGMFVAFAGDGVGAYFTPDDMMNLYVSWSASPAALLRNDRPLGALVYRVMFARFGLHPLPYRILCMALLLANLALLYRFCRALSGSREVAALACLLGAYHAHLADLYYSTGTLFDLLCCLFFLLAFTWYLRVRQTGYPSWRQTFGLLVLYGCALASKEMAVLLPVYIALYEGRRMVRIRFLWLAAPLTAVYAAWKVAGPRAMTANPAYALHLSLHVFLSAWKAYLNDLFYGAIAFNTVKLALLWIAVTLFAALARRREVWLAWCIAMLGVLPFVFIAPRGFFVMYLVLPGWYLLAAWALVGLREWLSRLAVTIAVRPEQLALFVVVALLLISVHRTEKPLGKAWVAGAHQQIRGVLGVLQARFPIMPRGGKVLFLSDPYDPDDWILTSMFRLQYHDPNLQVDRVKADPALAAKADGYAHVFTLDQNGLAVVR
jgi:hypothetical protein